jgi:RimJ/RimL family protein N-acetyltransferase
MRVLRCGAVTGEAYLLQRWPLFDLRLTCGEVTLQPMREADLAVLAGIYPDDSEHDPRAEMLDGLDLDANRRRLLLQTYWRDWGTFSVNSWALNFRVAHRDRVVGIQALEAEHFPELRTVDSSSWLAADCRGKGVGTAMRTAILALAFDHLGAQAAITSARHDNHASLGVSRRIGYRDNGVSMTRSPRGPCELRHMRLTRDEWAARSWSASVSVTGLAACAPYFGVEIMQPSGRHCP